MCRLSVRPEGFKLINIAQVLDQWGMSGNNTYQKKTSALTSCGTHREQRSVCLHWYIAQCLLKRGATVVDVFSYEHFFI